jgi:hypothetical protein
MMKQLAEHVAFDESHEVMQSVDFNFDGVDEALGFIHRSPPESREQAAELFRQLAAWCFPGNQPLRSAMVKFTAIVSGLRPELLDNRGGSELAAELGVTKQALSAASVKFSDAFGIQFSRGRLPEARQRMADARLGGPNRNTRPHPTSHEITNQTGPA